MNTTQTRKDVEVFISFFGGAGDGPGLFHSQIVKKVADAGFDDPRKIGLDGARI